MYVAPPRSNSTARALLIALPLLLIALVLTACNPAPDDGTETANDDTIEGQFCGGIAAMQCPEGYTCQLDGEYPDAGGVCVEN